MDKEKIKTNFISKIILIGVVALVAWCMKPISGRFYDPEDGDVIIFDDGELYESAVYVGPGVMDHAGEYSYSYGKVVMVICSIIFRLNCRHTLKNRFLQA